jgi:hypothetical protein
MRPTRERERMKERDGGRERQEERDRGRDAKRHQASHMLNKWCCARERD